MKRMLTFLVFFAGAAIAQEAKSPPVKEFVQARNFHGMDFRTASRYDAGAVPALREVLADEDMAPFWANAVWVLGVIATPETTAALIGFHEDRFQGYVGINQLQALLLVPQALGFAAHDPKSRAFEYLRNGVDPGVVARRKLGWTVRGWEPGTRELLLAKLHVNGLGLAANEAGREVLIGLRESVPEKSPEVWHKIAPNVFEALETSRRIEELGYLRAFVPEKVIYPPPQKRNSD